MKPKFRLTVYAALITLLFSLFHVTTAASARPSALDIPPLNQFIQTVQNGDADALRGAYVPGVLALTIAQQPENSSRFISENETMLTEFNMASRAGNVGLLAHNNLAGKLFSNLPEGSKIMLVYGDGRIETFVVETIKQYEALPYGAYKDASTEEILDTGELFNLVYAGEYHLTLQTCIENNGDLNWGRMFIVAKPIHRESAMGDAKKSESQTAFEWRYALYNMSGSEGNERTHSY